MFFDAPVLERGEVSKTRLKQFDLELLQPEEGYRFSVDSLLLAEFVRLKKGARQVVELGGGCGVVSLILARRYPGASFQILEIQSELFELCRRNVALNRLSDRAECVQGDIGQVRSIWPAAAFHHVVTNPPFRRPETGRLCLYSQEALARHEILVNLEQVLDAASYLLGSGGRFTIIFPAERCAELIHSMSSFRLEPKRIRMVHPRIDRQARMVMVEAVKDGGSQVRIEPPLFINREDGAA